MKKHGSPYKVCLWEQCRASREATSTNNRRFQKRHTKKKFRRMVKEAIMNGEWDNIPEAITGDYWA